MHMINIGLLGYINDVISLSILTLFNRDDIGNENLGNQTIQTVMDTTTHNAMQMKNSHGHTKS